VGVGGNFNQVVESVDDLVEVGAIVVSPESVVEQAAQGDRERRGVLTGCVVGAKEFARGILPPRDLESNRSARTDAAAPNRD
jgi:hypothetical protein